MEVRGAPRRSKELIVGTWDTGTFDNDTAADWAFGPYTEPVDQWVAAHPEPPSPALVAQAIAAIDRVTTEPCELLELWSEGDDFERWRASVADLRARVAG
jgi:hypothetical protein